jgi:hypothetical protein
MIRLASNNNFAGFRSSPKFEMGDQQQQQQQQQQHLTTNNKKIEVIV